MSGIQIKTKEQIAAMAEGGRKLSGIKDELRKIVKEGVNAGELEELANKLIAREGGKPSFKMVPGYNWATCVNRNEGVVHGVPGKNVVFKEGDVVSVDIGIFYKGFHTDSAFTVAINPVKKVENFLKTGQIALEKAIGKCAEGNYLSDISKTIEEVVRKEGFSPIKDLTGHGVGMELHEEPMIPCFYRGIKGPRLEEGMTLAIEVMYAMGGSDLVLDKDGWTISMRDGKISALYEETVAIVKHGPIVLTKQ